MVVMGREPFLGSKVREREKVGESTVGRDHTISHSEEIPWVTLGRIVPIPGVHLEEHILPFQGQKANWELLSSTQ